MIGPIFLTVGQVIFMHDQLELERPGVRDMPLLISAVMRCQSTWEGNLTHRSLFSQVAALVHGISQNQAFVDGNKRTAWLACDAFLELNGMRFVALDQDEVVAFMEEIGIGVHTLEDIAFWVALRVLPVD